MELITLAQGTKKNFHISADNIEINASQMKKLIQL